MSTIPGQGRGTSQKFSPSRGYRRLLGGFLPRESQTDLNFKERCTYRVDRARGREESGH
jgi:hypothetical protein